MVIELRCSSNFKEYSLVNAVSRAVNSLAAVRAGASSASAPGPDPRRWLMLPVVLMAMFMAGFDIWGLNGAAPPLQRDPPVSDASLQLVVRGCAFMYASGIVAGRRGGGPFWYRPGFLVRVGPFARP